MNDRFRFRCFDTDIQKFIVGFRLCDHYKWPNGIIEQCTGLKDKNGLLIYEGDIVKRHLKYSEKEKDIILQVEWNYKGGRYITTDKKHDTWFFSMFEYEYEVIGNIHENQELLKEHKCKKYS